MKKKTKVLSGIALGLLVVLGVSVYASGGSLQGRFGGSTPSPAPTLTLASSSPSGNHAPSVSDDIMAIKATSSIGRSTIPVGSVINFTFSCSAVVPVQTGSGTVKDSIGTASGTLKPLDLSFETIGCIDPAVTGTVSLKESGSTIATSGTITVVDDSTATVAVTFLSSNGPLEIDSGVPHTLVLNLNSNDLITDNHANDKLTVTASYNGQTVTGNVLTF